MKIPKIITMVILASAIDGCIPSLNPIYTEADLIFKPELIGLWASENSNELWKFEKTNESEYKLTHSKDTNYSTFSGHLVAIEEHTFLDLCLTELNSKDYLYKMHIIPIHTFSKISITNGLLSIEMFDPIWLEKGINSKEINIDHVISSDGTILLTASTADLKKFIQMSADNKDAFEEPMLLKKL